MPLSFLSPGLAVTFSEGRRVTGAGLVWVAGFLSVAVPVEAAGRVTVVLGRRTVVELSDLRVAVERLTEVLLEASEELLEVVAEEPLEVVAEEVLLAGVWRETFLSDD